MFCGVKIQINSTFHCIMLDLKYFLKTLQVIVLRSLRSFIRSESGAFLDLDYVRVFDEPRKHVFFGYYDCTPFDADERYLLALHAPISNRMPCPKDKVSVVTYDLKSSGHDFVSLGESDTWCWQQGCRLRWFPSAGNKCVIYNRMVEDQYGCVVQELESRIVKREIGLPIYDISPDGKWGLSLNFSRLHRLRPGYGYVNLPDETADSSAPENDGVWRVDMDTGAGELLFSVADVANFQFKGAMPDAQHYFNHLSIAPDGKRFMFFHLWDNGKRRYNRMLTCNIDGSDMYVLNDEGITSHYTWKDSQTLLACIARLPDGLRYIEFGDRSSEKKAIGAGVLNRDGHPSYSRDGGWILNDTYPDKYREQCLYLYHVTENVILEKARFYSPMSFWKDLRCDLHPRWSPSGRHLCADVPLRSGYRGMALIALNDFSG